MTNYTLGSGIATVDLVNGNFSTLFGEDGTSVLATLDVNGYSIAQSAIPAGNSNGISAWDTLFGSAANDLVIWHGRDTTSHGGFTQYSASSFQGLPGGSQTAAIDVFDLGSGDDILNLSFNSSLDSPGAYAWTATVYGGVGNDVLISGAGNDILFGGATGTVVDLNGTDTVFGGAGNDFINGAQGSDTLYGGTGGDTILGSEATDTVYGDTGDDNLFGGADGDFVYGGIGNDVLFFLANDGSADAVGAVGATTSGWDGVAGSAPITVGIFNKALSLDFRDGGSGLDTLLVANGASAGTDGSAYIAYSGTNLQLMAVERIVADTTNDIINLTFNNGATRLTYANDVTIVGADGNDIVFSGSGNDLITGGAEAVGGIANASANDTIFGGGGNDTIWGDTGGDFSESVGGGNDTIQGGTGDDTVYGGAGNDNIEGDAAGASGNDTLYGGSGNDLIAANIGDDAIDGGAGNDSAYGAAGDDFLTGGSGGLDTLYGGSENDTLQFVGDSLATGNDPTDFVQAWDGSSAANFTIGLTGAYNWSADIFDGGSETDTLTLTAGNDILVLNTNDIFVNNVNQGTNSGRLVALEVILAGVGADIVVMNDANTATPTSGIAFASALTIAGELGSDTIVSGTGNDLLVGDSLISGGPTANDLIFGGGGDDAIWGDDLDDPMGLAGGADTLYGGGGLDTIYGGGGDDTIFGAASADSQTDELFGGAGNDVIASVSSADAVGFDGADQITINQNNSVGSFFVFGGDDESPDDGGDRVVITGSYDVVSGSLGAGPDVYISNAVGTGNRTDIIDGESGDDAIATWQGADTIFGASGTDVLWGGAGSDVLFGGSGTDFLYAQEGDDTIYGGGDWDMVYFGRNDGNDQYWDVARLMPPPDPEDQTPPVDVRENWIVVYGAFDQSEVGAGADFLLNGVGVRETDHSLAEAVGGANMVQVTGTGNDFTMTVANTSGGTSSLQFDSRDVAGIGLWDNDALDGHVLQVYLWNGTTYAYSYSI